MNETERLALLQLWNRVYDAVTKFDEKLTEIVEDEEDDDWDSEEEGVPA